MKRLAELMWYFSYIGFFNIKSTNSVHNLSRAFSLNLWRVFSEFLQLFYSTPTKTATEPAAFLVVTNWVNIGILPELTYEILNYLHNNMFRFCGVCGFIH